MHVHCACCNVCHDQRNFDARARARGSAFQCFSRQVVRRQAVSTLYSPGATCRTGNRESAGHLWMTCQRVMSMSVATWCTAIVGMLRTAVDAAGRAPWPRRRHCLPAPPPRSPAAARATARGRCRPPHPRSGKLCICIAARAPAGGGTTRGERGSNGPHSKSGT